MSSKNSDKLIKERTELLAELSVLTHLLHGSWVERYSTCSVPGCKCHKGKRHGPRRYLVINEGGCQRQKYIANAHVGSAQEGIAQYRRSQEIIDRITRINLELMKECADDGW